MEATRALRSSEFIASNCSAWEGDYGLWPQHATWRYLALQHLLSLSAPENDFAFEDTGVVHQVDRDLQAGDGRRLAVFAADVAVIHRF
jgi:hypothetical protein